MALGSEKSSKGGGGGVQRFSALSGLRGRFGNAGREEEVRRVGSPVAALAGESTSRGRSLGVKGGGGGLRRGRGNTALNRFKKPSY